MENRDPNHNAARARAYEQFELSKRTSELLDAPASYTPAIPVTLGGSNPCAPPGVAELVHQLVQRLVNEVVYPALSATTRDAVFAELRARWNEYQKTNGAILVLLSTPAAENAFAERSTEDAIDAIASSAEAIVGPSGADEARFVAETYLSAIRLCARFSSMTPVPRDKVVEDRALAREFAEHSTMHTLGALMISVARVHRSTKEGIDVAFELFRAGALYAYAAARAAFDLRREEETITDDLLPFDDEDFALANAP